jgi:hypothetical protein
MREEEKKTAKSHMDLALKYILYPKSRNSTAE